MSSHSHEGHHPALQHHFFDMEQQHESVKLGVWLFLLTEILLFGGLFCFYALYRAHHPELFIAMAHFLDWKMGALNTAVLIISSVTVALAIRSIQQNKAKECAVLLGVTIALAGVFLVVKYFEYTHKFEMGIFPGEYFASQDVLNAAAAAGQANPHSFFSIYFLMTGLHGLHVVFGMIFLGWLLVRVLKGRYDSVNYVGIEMGGLYWHLVDLIWIYLFPLMYLI
jgi:cytochrome c oxidase subunit 3